ncbi:MAG: response regulator [Planctomycetota bacterium]
MPPAAIPQNEAERLASLMACGVLDTGPESDFDDLTQLAAELAGTPIALVSLVDADRQWFKSRVGLDAAQTPRSQAVCGFVVASQDDVVIPDLLNDSRTSDNPLVTSDGGLRCYAGFPLTLNNGHTLGSLCVIDTEPRELDVQTLRRLRMLARQAATQLDIRKQAGELAKARRDAEAASDAKSRFLANVSHEIRTPLTAIGGFADLILDLDESEFERHAVMEAVQRIALNGEHLLQLLNDVLDLSKVESGALKTESIETDVVEITRCVIAQLESLAHEKDLSLHLEWSGDPPSRVVTDPMRLRQILTNVVGNAIKFTSEGSVTVRCWHDEATAKARFDVVDTGIGMTEDQLARIREFRPFLQADNSTTRRFGGTGLGLGLTRNLVEKLGGWLTIDSVYEQGTTVRFEIDAPAADRSAPPTTDDGGQQPGETLAGRRVLIVDDSADNLRLIRAFLERAGADVVEAADGRQAIRRYELSPDPIDAIVMDMQMPILDGLDATRMLRDRGAEVPILALTANTRDEDREASFEAGCDGFLTKPIDRRELIAAVNRELSARRDAA